MGRFFFVRGRVPGIRALVVLVVIAGVTFGSAAVGAAKARRAAAAGALIAAEGVRTSGVNGSAYVVKYWSRTVSFAPVMVTGVVYVPHGTPPAGGWPVVSYAHGTDGASNSCAPSLEPSGDVPYINSLLDRGWEVTAADYQGEGNQSLAPTATGLSPHGVNPAAEHNIVDIVSAARHLGAAHASNHYVIWGYSEGGGAAAWASAYAPWYAPSLRLEGVVTTAPPVDLSQDFFGSASDGASPFTLMYVEGYHEAYGNKVSLTQLLTSKGEYFGGLLAHRCYDGMAQAMNNATVGQVFKTTVLPATFRYLLNANDPLYLATAGKAPLLIVQGADDTTDPPQGSDDLAVHLCGLHADVVLWTYPGLDHNSIVTGSAGDVVHWIADRFAGRPNPDSYAPGGAQTSSCH
jgi:pimeloyl-ACP methyl ester carboxylesterase